MQTLFRPQAVDYARRRRLEGEVILSAPFPLTVLAWILGAAFCLALALGCVATLTRTVTVDGWLVPDAGTIRATSPRSAVVERILVHEGDNVRHGDPLVQIGVLARVDIADGDFQNRGQSSIGLLEFRRREAALRQNLLRAEIAQNERQRTLQDSRIAIASERINALTALEGRGFLPAQEMASRRSGLLSMQQERAAIDARTLGLRRELNDTIAAGVEAEADAQTTVLAPVDGRVLAIRIHEGENVPAGVAVALIAPEGSRLEAELFAPSRAAGFIARDQDVRLKFDSFPFQRFGAGAGRVLSVSDTVLAPQEVAIPGLEPSTPVFRVRVSLQSSSISAYGHQIPLRAGMRFTADIVTGRQTVLQWVLDPLYAARRAAR
jgi:membrane fusion protein